MASKEEIDTLIRKKGRQVVELEAESKRIKEEDIQPLLDEVKPLQDAIEENTENAAQLRAEILELMLDNERQDYFCKWFSATLRKVAAKLSVPDVKKLAPAFVIQEPKANMPVIKAYFEEKGRAPKGVDVTPESKTLVMTVPKD